MKKGRLLPVAVVTCACLALSQETDGRKHLKIPVASGSAPLSASATSILRDMKYPSSVHLSGSVEIIMPMCYRPAPEQSLTCPREMVLTGDNVVVHEDTGEIEASGTVRVIPIRTVR
jgi:hypothetical protein